jgi:hypothetical protein
MSVKKEGLLESRLMGENKVCYTHTHTHPHTHKWKQHNEIYQTIPKSGALGRYNENIMESVNLFKIHFIHIWYYCKKHFMLWNYPKK